MKCDNCEHKDYFDECTMDNCKECPCYKNGCCKLGGIIIDGGLGSLIKTLS